MTLPVRTTDNAPAPAWHVPHDLDGALALAEHIRQSKLAPDGLSASDIVVVLMRGHELGLGPMQALDGINVIKGRATLSSDLMAALVLRSGHAEYLDCVESTDKQATFATRRVGSERETRVTFTLAEARRAGLLERRGRGPNMWELYPAQMLSARARARICRLVYPDVVAGVYTPEEIASIRDVTPAREVEVEVEGELVDIRSEPDATDPVVERGERVIADIAEAWSLSPDHVRGLLRVEVALVREARRAKGMGPREVTVHDVEDASARVIATLQEGEVIAADAEDPTPAPSQLDPIVDGLVRQQGADPDHALELVLAAVEDVTGELHTDGTTYGRDSLGDIRSRARELLTDCIVDEADVQRAEHELRPDRTEASR